MHGIIFKVGIHKLSVPLFCLIMLWPASLRGQSEIPLNDLSFFKAPGKTWYVAGHVTADLQNANILNVTDGTGVLVNTPDKKNKGEDLFTRSEHGDIDLELDYMMAKGSNSGIYLQGRYEIQLHDTWGSARPTSGSNGGIYERWDDTRPQVKKGYEGYAPRQNSSLAPGLWQHLKISFKAPVFDGRGKKTAHAKILRIELNGVVIHENVELSGPTRGAISTEEKGTGPLRLQGDHGSVAFRNMKITRYDDGYPLENLTTRAGPVYPILVNAHTRPVFRSFMDLSDGTRVVHAVSIASPYNVHYTYDADTGMILQVWRGDFLDATRMWHGRGDGSSRPVGAVQQFGKPMPALAKLSSSQSMWIKDTMGTGFRAKGYVLNKDDRPVFQYEIYGSKVTDEISALNNGQGIRREITIQTPVTGLYVRLAEDSSIKKISKGLYLVGDNSYYLELDAGSDMKGVVRNNAGKKELLVPVTDKLAYSILF